MKSLLEYLCESPEHINEGKNFIGEILHLEDPKKIRKYFNETAFRGFKKSDAVKKIYHNFSDEEYDVVEIAVGTVIDYCDRKLEELEDGDIDVETFVAYLRGVGNDWVDYSKLAREFDESETGDSVGLSGKDLADMVLDDWAKIWKTGTRMEWN